MNEFGNQNFDDRARQVRAYNEHKAPHSIPRFAPQHPAAVSLKAIADGYDQLAKACRAMAKGEPYRHRTPSGSDCGMSVEVPVADAIFLGNWLKGIREDHGATFWVCGGCGQEQRDPDAVWWNGDQPLCVGCADHARPDPVDYGSGEGDE